MTTVVWFALGVGVSTAAALLVGGRLLRAQSPVLAPPDLAEGADRALALILRANRADGVWVSGVPGVDDARLALSARLGTAQREHIAARLGQLARTPQGGTEVMDGGTLVFRGDGQRVAAILLAARPSRGAIDAARHDLSHLLEDLRQRPVLERLQRQQDRPGESLESIAMRLGHEIERLLDTEVAVAVARPVGVQVLGVSLRSDPRLLLTLAAPGSPLDQVGRGAAAGPVLSDDPLGLAGAERRRSRPRSVVLPIPRGDQVVGAVMLALPEGALPKGAVLGELLGALGRAGPRLEAAAHHHALQEKAATDPLTGLRNRRALQDALARAEPAGGALIVADLDHFKALNDTLGHAAGDAALVHFARLLGERTRAGDVAARTGGEEFAIWLPGVALLEASTAAERIRGALELTPWRWQGQAWPLAASFGVAACPETVPSLGELAVRADDALYQAKRGGRNRVVTAM